ncbi:MAG: anthranilate phosphoribosyltransferase [Sulfurovum sp.]
MNTKEQFQRLFNNQMPTDEAREFLIGLYDKGESSEEIAISAQIMREHSIKIPLSDELREKAIDIVGTGGDKSGSFNISTTVSLLLASMGRVVAKHGNRSITSNSGSTDVLEALGINLNLTIPNKINMLQECGFCFFPATDHHPAMKHIMPIRKSIPHRTIFNILGPLTNPAQASNYLLGVFDASFIRRMAEALVVLDTKRAFVVSSLDGMDEIGISGDTAFAYIESGRISEGVIDPREHGFDLAPKEAILGGDAKHNAQITRDILSGVEEGAKRDIVLLNSAYALFADGGVRDLKEALDMAKDMLESGKALKHLEFMAEISHKLA